MCQRAGENFMGGGSVSPTNTEKGHSDKLKTKYVDCPRDATNDDKRYNNAWTRIDLE